MRALSIRNKVRSNTYNEYLDVRKSYSNYYNKIFAPNVEPIDVEKLFKDSMEKGDEEMTLYYAASIIEKMILKLLYR